MKLLFSYKRKKEYKKDCRGAAPDPLLRKTEKRFAEVPCVITAASVQDTHKFQTVRHGCVT